MADYVLTTQQQENYELVTQEGNAAPFVAKPISAEGVVSVAGTAPITSSGGAMPTIAITAATDGAAGSMSAADKTKLDGITAGAAVASVAGTAPITSSGGATPNIAITAATDGAAGSMSAADKTKLDGITAGAAVASVAGTAPIASSGGATPTISLVSLLGVPVTPAAGATTDLARAFVSVVFQDASGGVAANIELPAAPADGDAVVVKVDGAVATPPQITARGGFVVEDPGNPGNYSAANGHVVLTVQGQSAWWQFKTTKWRQIA